MSTAAKDNMMISYKLDDTNYTLWSFAMETMMTDANLLHTVVACHGDYDDRYESDECHRRHQYIRGCQEKAKAMNAIGKNVSMGQMSLLMAHKGNPKRAWDGLETEHAGSTSQDVATTVIKINNVKLPQDATVDFARDHCAEMMMIAMKLEAEDVTLKLGEADLATRMLMSLPDEFEPIK